MRFYSLFDFGSAQKKTSSRELEVEPAGPLSSFFWISWFVFCIWCFFLGGNFPYTSNNAPRHHQDHDAVGSKSTAVDAGLASCIGRGDWHASPSAPGMVMVEALAPVKEGHCQATPNAAEAVNRAGIHWVINLQLLEKHRCTLVDNGSDQSCGKSTTTFHAAAAGCNGDQACEDAIAQATNIVLLHDEVTKHEHCDSARGSCNRGIHRHLGCHSTVAATFHCQSGAWVEAIPAEPQRKGAEHHQREIVAIKLLIQKTTTSPTRSNCRSSLKADSSALISKPKELQVV